jgi:hypothetical protein
MKYFSTIALALTGLMLSSCDGQAESSTTTERHAQETLSQQAAVAVGMPAIINFAEKRQLKAILELRDQANLVTYSYTIDMNGRRHTACPTTSVGYGIPYATQYTNPSRVPTTWETSDHGNVVLPQADPNALFSPADAHGTWILCLNPKDKSLAPAYIESDVSVYLFEMPHAD